ncbi:MAG TPA: N-acetylmuramic acid 6-phosphate etherase [Acidimicrobiia bacterium]|nr:N-acetylmuramic acid 6-phosphate etherase [Acidimicrobiia bacterium]
MELADLVTEQLRPELADLDLRSTAELVRLMTDDQKEALEAVADAANSIAAAIEAVHARLEGGGRLIYVGAGTAGRLGLLDAAECPPTFNTDRVIAVLAGGPAAFDVSREAVEDDLAAGADDMDRLEISQADVVVGLSASGRTPYTIGAVAKAKRLGAVTVGIACNPNSLLSRQVDYPIEVLVGPEVIAGSTRLKAGTAQKTVLNMISTITMIRLGKTFGNLMVDLRASNEKLRDRARRIVAQATGVEPSRVDEVLVEANGEVKVAIVMVLAGLDANQARQRLAAHGGMVRKALGVEDDL